MYLATLRPQNSALSTYFIATLDGVGGGGAHKTHNTTNKKSHAKKRGFKTSMQSND
jgi:hypothetical protein